MALKFKLDKLEGLDQAITPLYVQNDEDKMFYLDVEGVVTKEKLEEFRTNNITLKQENETLKGAYKDVDPKKYKELLSLEASGKLHGKTKDEIDAIIQERVGTMRTELETTIADKDKVIGTQAAQLNLLLVDNVVRDAASKVGVTGPAVDDILLRSKSVFKLVDGKPVPHDDRNNIIYGNDGTTPLSVSGWVTGLKKTAPHLFPQSAGSGALGGRGAGSASRDNMTPLEKIQSALAEKS